MMDWSTQEAQCDEAQKEYAAKIMDLLESMVKDLVEAGICTAVVVKRGEYDDIIIDSIMAVGCGPAKHLHEVVDHDAHRAFDLIAYELVMNLNMNDTVTITGGN